MTCLEIDQITKVLNICGTPTNETLSKITSEEVFNAVFVYLYRCNFPDIFSLKGDSLYPFPSTNGETRLSDSFPRCESYGLEWLEKMCDIRGFVSSNRFDGKNARG